MTVNLEIPFCDDGQVHLSMTRKLSQHVIEKRNPRVDLVLPGAIEVQADTDIRFFGLAAFRHRSRFRHRVSSARSRALRNRLFSSGVPVEMRSTRSSIGYELTS